MNTPSPAAWCGCSVAARQALAIAGLLALGLSVNGLCFAIARAFG